MSDQSHIESDVAGIEAAEQSEAQSLVEIQADYDAFKAAHPAVDFTSLDKAFADAKTNADTASAQAAADAPAPTPDPAPPAA